MNGVTGERTMRKGEIKEIRVAWWCWLSDGWKYQKKKKEVSRAEKRSRGKKENILTLYPSSKNYQLSTIISYRYLGTVGLMGFGQS